MFLEQLATSQIDSVLEAVYMTALGAIVGIGLSKLYEWLKDELGFGAGND